MNGNHTAKDLKLSTFYNLTRKFSVAYCCASFFVQYIFVNLVAQLNQMLENKITSSFIRINLVRVKNIVVSKVGNICNRIDTMHSINHESALGENKARPD